MSTLHEIKTVSFHNRKPSKPTVTKAIRDAMKQGYKAIDISYGENLIELVYHDRHMQWYGSGWIKTIGGSDLADDINNAKQSNTTQFMRQHFNLLGEALN